MSGKSRFTIIGLTFSFVVYLFFTLFDQSRPEEEVFEEQLEKQQKKIDSITRYDSVIKEIIGLDSNKRYLEKVQEVKSKLHQYRYSDSTTINKHKRDDSIWNEMILEGQRNIERNKK